MGVFRRVRCTKLLLLTNSQPHKNDQFLRPESRGLYSWEFHRLFFSFLHQIEFLLQDRNLLL